MNGLPRLEATERCSRCGALGAADPCASCAADPARTRDVARTSDVTLSLVGRTLADRYEILALLADGGMGRVYRARQTSLGREVALKVIHPGFADAGVGVERFMREAQAASRINHPHIVSVFDFGRTTDAEGGHLFLVMELLDGPDLETALGREGPLPLGRVATILGQTLEALGEAHRLGITHRDIKPANIVLMPRRSGHDHVKVIDFGIAMVQQHGRITEHGKFCGSPAYTAPEQASGGPIGPWTDIYSAGVLLFELLTGKLLFDGSPAHVLLSHMRAPRPDPRLVAPHRNIPDALAEACLEALAIDPADRFESAEAFGDAIAEALDALEPSGPYLTAAATVVAFSANEPTPPAPAVHRSDAAFISDTLPQLAVITDLDAHAAMRAPTPPDRPTPGKTRTSTTNRSREMVWARGLFAGPHQPQAVALWGRPGAGRTRLLDELATVAEQMDTLVLRVPLAPPPRNVVGYGALREVVIALTGLTADDLFDVRVAGATDRRTWIGLRAVFDATLDLSTTDPGTLRAGAAAVLAWAAQRAALRASSGRALLVLDDVERLDTSSRLAFDALLQGEPVAGFTLLMTGEQPPTPAFADPDHVESRTISGLRRAGAQKLLAKLREGATLARDDDDIEPLYVVELARLEPSYEPSAPARLDDLVDFRVLGLPPAERRVLQAIAVVGSADIPMLTRLLGGAEGLDDAVKSLETGGFLRVRDGELTLAHALFGRSALATAPAAALMDLHQTAAALHAEASAPMELRAWHALRGRPDFHTFLLVETAARLRAARGDRGGALDALTQAIDAARSLGLRGEVEVAAAAWSNFGRKLATALADEGRLDEAQGVLAEMLDVAALGEGDRARVLAQFTELTQRRTSAPRAAR